MVVKADKYLFDPSFFTDKETAIDFIQSFLNAASEYSIIGTDIENTIKFWSEGAHKLYGYEGAEVINKLDARTLFSQEEIVSGRIDEIHKAVLETGKWEGNLKRKKKNGDIFFTRASVTGRFDDEGRLKGFLYISLDLSKEMQAGEQLQFLYNKLKEHAGRLEKEMQQSHEKEALLNLSHRVISLLVSANTMDEGFQSFLKLTVEHFHFSLGLILLKSPTNNEVSCVGSFSPEQTANIDLCIQKSQSLAFFLDELLKDPSHLERVGKESDFNYTLTTPIIVEEKILGILVFFKEEKLDKEPFTKDFFRDLGRELGVFFVRKKAEKDLTEALIKKDLYLKEIYHRIKNNLQIVASLLNLQTRYLTGRSAEQVLKESVNRIQSMALIHEKLYKSDDLEYVNFPEYLEGLVKHLYSAYDVSLRTIGLKIDSNVAKIKAKAIINLGLIITEIVSNSLKYAFPEKKEGLITISLQRDQDLAHLEVIDTGIGLPATFNFEKTPTLGLRLVDNLAKQMGGTVTFENASGTVFRFIFPYKEIA